MKRIEFIIPVLADAISGAFGGAVFGNLISGYRIAIIAAIIGAVIIIFSDIRILPKKRSHKTA